MTSTKEVIDHRVIVITRFAVPTAINASQMRAAFTQAAPAFRKVPGLIRKQFLLSPDGHTAGGVYLWETEEAARSFMQERVAPMIRETFRVEPAIEFYHSPVLVENGEPQNVPA
jgi:heme-degrading monooxygenase HmoA